MSQPPPMPSTGSPVPPQSPGKNRKILLIGCAVLALLFVGLIVVGVAGWLIYRAKGNAGGVTSGSVRSGQTADNGPGLGAILSQYKHAGGSACIVGPDGAWHAVFQEMADYGKPILIYHRVSRDGGKSWSAPVAISSDGTGNGSSYPRMGQDAQGNVFAAWIRFGQGGRVITESILDGPGGYVEGTLMLRRWNGTQWDPAMTVGTKEGVRSFCFFNAADGSLRILWGEKDGMIAHCPALGGDGVVAVPAGAIPCDNPTYNRPRNLDAVPDAQGGVIVLAERTLDSAQQLVLWGGGQLAVLAAEPKYQTRNTFNYPARMFADATGKVHVIYNPNSKTVEREELWDIDPVSGQHTAIFSGLGPKDAIQNFQVLATSRAAYVTIEWSAKAAIVADSTDVVALTFDGQRWSEPRGLTGNSRAESFFHKDLPGGDVALMERYHAKHASLAVDATGKVHALATIDALSTFSSGTHERIGGENFNVTSGASVSQPSLYVLPWE